MARKLFFSIIVFVIFLGSCKKKSDDIVNDGSNPLVFTSLTPSDSLVVVGTFITLSAVATGEGLTYVWDSKDLNGSDYGTFFGSGSVLEWTICHSDKFIITCTVTDKFKQTASKSIQVRSHIK